MLKKTSSLMTVGGIVGGIGLGLFGIPVATLTYYAQVVKTGPPGWFNDCIFPMILAGAVFAMVGNVIVGVAGKGADDHSTPAQVNAAGAVVTAMTPAAVEQAKVQVKQADAQVDKKP